MAGGRKLSLPRVSSFALWATITGLLVLGMMTTLVDFIGLSDHESKRANDAKQRFVINAVTGEVMLSSNPHAVEETTFDVATPEAPPAAAPEAEAPAQAEATPETAPTEGEHSAVEAPTEPASESSPSTEPASDHSAAVQEAAAPETVAHETATPEAAPTPEPEPTIANAPSLRTAPIEAALTAPVHTKNSLVPAPAREVSESIHGLTLPKRGDNDLLPSKLYARPFSRKEGQATLSFVIMEAGLDTQSIGLIMNLPPEVTVAYSPYSRKTTSYSENLRSLGHEVWTMLPAMNDNYPSDDPGPMGIISKMPPEEALRRTQEVLAAIAGSVGLITAPNEALTTSAENVAPVLGEISKRGLLMLSTHPTRTLSQMTTNRGILEMMRRADLVLDPAPNEAQIRSKLAGILAAAKEKGDYVVVLSARPQSLQLLAEWLKANPLDESIALAPLSAMFVPKEAPQPKAEEAAAAAEGEHAAPPKKEKKKEKPAEKKQKPLPQDKYLKPAAAEKSSGGH